MDNASPSVHDNHTIAYTVNGRDRIIVIQTVHPHTEPAGLTDVIFEDVLAYQFQHDLFGNILSDIEEVDLVHVITSQGALFESGSQWGWPLGWESGKESLVDYFQRSGMKAFELSSSYGMTGWVVARRMVKTRKN